MGTGLIGEDERFFNGACLAVNGRGMVNDG